MDDSETVRYTLSDHEPPSLGVLRAVASLEDREIVDLDPRLYEVVDPDALDSLFAAAGDATGARVTFTYRGYDVTVHAEGRVVVESDT